MGRRNRRRDSSGIFAALLVLLGLTRSFTTRSSRPAFTPRRSSGWGPIATMVFMVGAFIVLGVFMAVLASIAAIAQSPAIATLCAIPLAIVAFLVWAVRRNSAPAQTQFPADADGSTDAGRTERERQERAERTGAWARPGETRTSPQPASTGLPAGGERRERSLAEEYPEKGQRPPGEYRQRAVSYRRRIESLLKKRRPGPVAERIRGVLEKLRNWEERVSQLADRLSLFETDELIQRDLREVPGHIERLRRQVNLEADPEMKGSISRTLAAYEEQLRQLRLLARVMRRTRFNLDDTLAAMGTVYSQVQVLNAMDIDAPSAARIDNEIGREVERLNDLMSALGEVYAASAEAADPQPQNLVDDESTGLNGRRTRLGRDAAG